MEIKLKQFYSDEVIAILQDVYIAEKLRKCQELREKFPRYKKISNVQIMEYALRMYIRQKERTLRNKIKRGVQNGS